MKYSFLLPVHRPDDIDQTIMSIIHQTHKDFEVIIVDDGSPYDWPQLLEPYMVEGCISYYRNPTSVGTDSPADLWNQCLQYAQGDFVILCHGRHVYDFEYLEEMERLTLQYPDHHIFSCRKKIVNSYTSLVDLDGHLPEQITRPDLACRLFDKVIYGTIANCTIRREVLLAQGGYIPFPQGKFTDEATLLTLSQDGLIISPRLLFSLRISNSHTPVISDPAVTLQKLQATIDFHRWSTQNIHPTLQADKSDIGRLYTYRYGRHLTFYLQSKMSLAVRHHLWPALRFLYGHRGYPPFITLPWLIRLACRTLRAQVTTYLLTRFTKRNPNPFAEENIMIQEA